MRTIYGHSKKVQKHTPDKRAMSAAFLLANITKKNIQTNCKTIETNENKIKYKKTKQIKHFMRGKSARSMKCPAEKVNIFKWELNDG